MSVTARSSSLSFSGIRVNSSDFVAVICGFALSETVQEMVTVRVPSSGRTTVAW